MRCRDFERHLAGWVGEGLTAEDRSACERHLATCTGCRELAELAAFAAEPADPGPGFVEGVMARTVGARQAPLSAAAASPEPPADASRAGRRGRRAWSLDLGKGADLWSRLVRRPRFALEAAYVLTLVLTPLVAWSGAPGRTLELVGRAGRMGSGAVMTASRGLTEGAAEQAGWLGTAAGAELRTFGTRLASSMERGRNDGPHDPNQKKGDAP